MSITQKEVRSLLILRYVSNCADPAMHYIVMGGAAFFGLALISGSKLVGILAIISVLSHFWFLSRVEK